MKNDDSSSLYDSFLKPGTLYIPKLMAKFIQVVQMPYLIGALIQCMNNIWGPAGWFIINVLWIE